MLKRTTALAIVLFFGFGGLATENAQPPNIFSSSIGGFLGPSFFVNLQKSKVIYQYGPQGAKIIMEFKPSKQQWQEFYSLIKKADVWNWKNEYNNPKVLDGTQWNLEIRVNNKHKTVHGNNSFPLQFEIYKKAVKIIIDGHDFY